MSAPIAFEDSSKPWFGPRKRAREFLRNRPEAMPPEQACLRIAELSGDLCDGIQRIRFIDFSHKDDENFRYYDRLGVDLFGRLTSQRPELLAGNLACLDYSVAKGGFLCAYRWNGEKQLSNQNFMWVGGGR